MSSLAFPHGAARGSRAPRALPAVFSRRGSDVLVAVAIMAVATVLVANLPSAFDVDSWLALVAGRDIWQNGFPHHETLTVLSQGAAWIDQQWLSQLGSYGLYKLGGLALLGLANVAMIALAIGGAIVGARRLGAHPKAVMAVLPLALFMIVPSRQVRTQEFAMPLFVALAYLLSTDSRSPSRRVYWCLPILVLWANLHGTVTVGALLVALRGATVAWERREALIRSLRVRGGLVRGQWRQWTCPLALGLGGPLCLLLTPYGLRIIGYYRTTMLGGTLRHTVSEWQPITSSPGTAAVFFLAAGIAVWSFGRFASRTTLWERIALLVLVAGSISVIRNILFFGLFALMVMPVSLAIGARARGAGEGSEQAGGAAAWGADRRRGRVNALLAFTALAAVLVAGVATLLRPASTLELNYQRPAMLAAVERATHSDPSLKVLAEDRFADWLLWRDPALSGRIANDVRFELLSASQLNQINDVYGVIGPSWKQGAHGFRLIVMDKKYVPAAAQAFTHEAGSRVIYNDGERLVILRSASAAG
jgi:hypothetical protein